MNLKNQAKRLADLILSTKPVQYKQYLIWEPYGNYIRHMQ